MNVAYYIGCKNFSGYKCSNCSAKISNKEKENGNHKYCYKCGAKIIKQEEYDLLKNK